jgi:Skp family chaperone for outer membrane proteins
MPPDTPIAQPPNVTGDSLAQVAHAIGPWGFVACVALFVLWKIATKYLDVLAQRKEIEHKALTELVDTVAALKKEYEEDSARREARFKVLDELVERVATLQKDQDQDRELWRARFEALDKRTPRAMFDAP